MYDIAKKITGYSKAPDSGSGKSWGGQYREYVMDLLNKPSITIEIGAGSRRTGDGKVERRRALICS